MIMKILAVPALALLVSACAGTGGLTTTQIATLEQAVAVGGAKSSDINPGDAYTSRTECAVLNGSWGTGLGGVGFSGASLPGCSLNGAVGGFQPFTGPTVVGRTGTILN